MRRIKFAVIAVMALVLMASVAVPAVARGGAGKMADRGAGRGDGMCPLFTVEQQEQIDKIHQKYDDQRVELSNRLKVMSGEMRELVAAEGEPNFKAIEKKMEDMAAIRLDLAKLRLRIHQEVRPLLTDDQKTLFDRGLGRGMMRGMRDGARGEGRMGHAMRAGAMGQGAMMYQRPGGMCGMPGMGVGMNQRGMGMPCPFQPGAPQEIEIEEAE